MCTHQHRHTSTHTHIPDLWSRQHHPQTTCPIHQPPAIPLCQRTKHVYSQYQIILVHLTLTVYQPPHQISNWTLQQRVYQTLYQRSTSIVSGIMIVPYFRPDTARKKYRYGNRLVPHSVLVLNLEHIPLTHTHTDTQICSYVHWYTHTHTHTQSLCIPQNNDSVAMGYILHNIHIRLSAILNNRCICNAPNPSVDIYIYVRFKVLYMKQ